MTDDHPAEDADPSAEIIDPRANEILAEQAAAEERERRRAEAVTWLRRGDDVELAGSIAKQLTDAGEWVHSAEQFWRYSSTSGAWEGQDREEIRGMTMSLAGTKVYRGEDKNGTPISRALSMSSGKVDGILRCTETLLHERDFFDGAATGIAFRNAFVTVTEHGEIVEKPHSSDHRARFALAYDYKDHACPTWRAFLRDVFQGDDDAIDKIECIREFVGLCLIGRVVGFEKSLILLGAGSNGKSVLLQTVLDIFPPRARSSVPPQLWGEDYHLARLDGSAINVVGELPEREILQSASLKQVISGDQVTARRPRENPFDFRPRAGHIFSANLLPQVNDFSPGFWRRWTLISFNRSFMGSDAEVKEKLLAKLAAEIPGIVYWALEGAATAIRAGVLCNVPTSSKVLEKWRKSSDQVATFLDEETTTSTEKYNVDEIYRAYRSWSARSGHKLIGRNRFRDRLTAAGVRCENDNAGRWWAGVKPKVAASSSGAPSADDGDGEPA